MVSQFIKLPSHSVEVFAPADFKRLVTNVPPDELLYVYQYVGRK